MSFHTKSSFVIRRVLIQIKKRKTICIMHVDFVYISFFLICHCMEVFFHPRFSTKFSRPSEGERRARANLSDTRKGIIQTFNRYQFTFTCRKNRKMIPTRVMCIHTRDRCMPSYWENMQLRKVFVYNVCSFYVKTRVYLERFYHILTKTCNGHLGTSLSMSATILNRKTKLNYNSRMNHLLQYVSVY